jgi:pentatricopeptide repeat protein
VPPAFDYYMVVIRNVMIACCARLDDLALVRRICNEMVIADL